MLRKKIGQLVDLIRKAEHLEINTKWLKALLIAKDMTRALTTPPSSAMPSAMRVDFPWTNEHEQALALHIGPHRTYGIFLMIAEKPRTLEEINAAVPPHDLDWTQTMVWDLLEAGLIRPTASDPQRYEITDRGLRVREALDQIPQAIKDEAWRKNWFPTDEELRQIEAGA